MIANTGGGRSSLDSNTVLASIHTFDPTAGCDPVSFQPFSDRALANLKKYVVSFRRVYPLNKDARATDPVATGRYPGGVYIGGNPSCCLATLAVAEQLYHARFTWDTFRVIDVTPISQTFFAQFVPGIAPGTYCADSDSDSTSTTYSRLSDCRAIHSHRRRARRAVRQGQRRPSERSRSVVEVRGRANITFRARKGGSGGAWGAKNLEVVS